MSEHTRMLDPRRAPGAAEVAEWIGPRNNARWNALTGFIQSEYPGVFQVDWWFGGKKFGWSLRFKKSKSFCNLIPERGQFKVLLVFGAEERAKVDALLPSLTSHVRDDYANARTFHDGRWVPVVVDSRHVLADVERLLALKRRPTSQPPRGDSPSPPARSLRTRDRRR